MTPKRNTDLTQRAYFHTRCAKDKLVLQTNLPVDGLIRILHIGKIHPLVILLFNENKMLCQTAIDTFT